MLDNLRTAILFLIIGLFELGGCYMIWLWIREQREVWYAVVGAILLILYGIIPTLQPTHLGGCISCMVGCLLSSLSSGAGA